MEKIKKNKNLIITFLIFSIFIIVSAKLAFFSGRMGWEDESHFWIIIKNCSVGQIFELMKVEGHMMLWYLAVKPFTCFPYPYPMQIINWLFCLGAMIILWKKSPFNIFTKSLIVLNPLFMCLYSVHARCYSIGILFLFLACALYKERLTRPYIYFLILFLAANTSIPALISASAIGILFLYDLVRNKKFVPASIVTLLTTLTGIMFFFQFHGVQVPDYETIGRNIVNSHNVVGMFFGTIPVTGDYVLLSKIISARIFVLVMTGIFATRARAFFVYIFTFGLAVYLFTYVYLPRFWHSAFFLIYFLICYWIFIEEKPTEKYLNIFKKITYILLLAMLVTSAEIPHEENFLLETILKRKNLSNGKLFTTTVPIVMAPILPKLNENGIYLYDMHGRNLSSFEGLKTYFDKNAKIWEPKDISENLSKEKTNYLITYWKVRPNSRLLKTLKLKLKLEGYRDGIHYWIYEIQPINNLNKIK